ncbi:hypothetical protein PINS_up021187 [Pythium insidiosum]|nr:hypothetical protein PINS_up021187 [Pythium insidiosum]
MNPETTVGQRAAVYIDKDVYTTSSTGNVMPLTAAPMYYNSTYKNVDKLIISERNNNDDPGWIKQYSGVWRPGEWSKNTLNAEAIKAWYAIGAGPDPQWVENLVILALMDEYTPNQFGNLNVFVDLRYVVQFKDLKQTFRYPTLGDTPVTLSCPDDVI